MYLSCAEIENFRSFRHLVAEFRPGLNVLIGRNNTGKTNLLRAIRHALGPSASRGDALWLERDDFYKESAGDKAERTISIILTFAGLSEAQRAQYYEIVDFDLNDLSKSKAIIRFEASWPQEKRQASIRRTGGPLISEPLEVSAEILQSLPITFLPALRDAETSLAPGYRSRLALLLLDRARRMGGAVETQITSIYEEANKELEGSPLIMETAAALLDTTDNLAGSDYSRSIINAGSVEFARILRMLQVQMDGSPVGDLAANGLGYNNLLYMAVILIHLKDPDPNESPLLLIEEPEAHLHPQLTALLADYLTYNTPGKTAPQTIVTTHSPTLAASIRPDSVHLLFTDASSRLIRCSSVAKAGMDEAELGQLRRFMDVTRATLYFAKGVLLVEGISEALLVPALAMRLGYDLTRMHISVIPICGVAFKTFKKLLNPCVLGIRVAIVTDADPSVCEDAGWQSALPESTNGAFARSDRTQKLIGDFAKHTNVKVFCSKVTLEYDLAQAGQANPIVMARIWETCFDGTPRTFSRSIVEAAGKDLEAQALAAWRGICVAKHSGSKAEFAHRLATCLTRKEREQFEVEFSVPDYLGQAIKYVATEIPYIDRSQ